MNYCGNYDNKADSCGASYGAEMLITWSEHVWLLAIIYNYQR